MTTSSHEAGKSDVIELPVITTTDNLDVALAELSHPLSEARLRELTTAAELLDLIDEALRLEGEDSDAA